LKKEHLFTFFCAKYKNAQKLSSHLWFFHGFCRFFNPKYTVLIDCGLVPNENAIISFFKAMEHDPQIGGCCGFMGCKPERETDEYGEDRTGIKNN
jgi:chitin synthase